MPLVDRAVGILQRLNQLTLAATRILHELRTVLTRPARLLFGGTRVMRVTAARAQIQNPHRLVCHCFLLSCCRDSEV